MMSAVRSTQGGGQVEQRTSADDGLRSAAGGAAAATAFPEATEAALEILRAGGNAVDAAVAAAWTLSVCEPSASGLGGQTTLLVYHANGTVRIIDGHSHAPAAVSPNSVSRRQQRVGHRACTIPSTPATLAYAQRKYGVLLPARALDPAIRTAEDGFGITQLQRRQIRWVVGDLRKHGATADLLLLNGEPPPVGHIFRQPRLAGTLRRLATQGVEDFYHGNMAHAIAEDMRRHGGLISTNDLSAFALPVEREPLWVSYRGLRAVSVPPPGGGVQLFLALKVLEQLLPPDNALDSAAWYEAIALATYAAWRERERGPISPAALTPSVRSWLFSEERIRQVATGIREENLADHRTRVAEGPGDTTHLTVADRDGNVVALTQSIQSVFGAKVANPQLGFVYNNYLCTCPRRQHPYGLSGNCMPQSNAAPTLVFQDSSRGCVPMLALGGAGSRRITSALLQVISSVVDRGRAVDEAVATPRIHALLSRKVWIEEPAADPELIANLLGRFAEVRIMPARSYKLGAVQALLCSPEGKVQAAADPRRDGTAGSIC